MKTGKGYGNDRTNKELWIKLIWQFSDNSIDKGVRLTMSQKELHITFKHQTLGQWKIY